MERYFVDVKTDRIVRDDLCTVRLEKGNGEILEHLEPKRLFPFTRPDEYISLKVDDREEAAMVRRLSDLSEESQTALQECFAEIAETLKQQRAVRSSGSEKGQKIHGQPERKRSADQKFVNVGAV